MHHERAFPVEAVDAAHEALSQKASVTDSILVHEKSGTDEKRHEVKFVVSDIRGPVSTANFASLAAFLGHLKPQHLRNGLAAIT